MIKNRLNILYRLFSVVFMVLVAAVLVFPIVMPHILLEEDEISVYDIPFEEEQNNETEESKEENNQQEKELEDLFFCNHLKVESTLKSNWYAKDFIFLYKVCHFLEISTPPPESV